MNELRSDAPLVAFRADASIEMGTGHLMRCLTLADRLRAAGHATIFLISPPAAHWSGHVEARGHTVKVLNLPKGALAEGLDGTAHASWLPWGWQRDADSTQAALSSRVAWLVVDHYGLDTRWEQAVRARADRILVIDDLADRPHDCDILLDQNPQDDEGSRYDGLVPDGCQRLIGPRYALLRPEFAEMAAEPRRERGSIERINIFFGGIDAPGATLAALEAVQLAGLSHVPVDVVIGSQSPHLAAIRNMAASLAAASVHVDATDMAALFARASIGVGASGVAALERCCVGLPAVALATAANQERGLRALAAAGACIACGPGTHATPQVLADALSTRAADRARLAAMSQIARSVVQGHGAGYVAAAIGAMESKSISIRPASESDLELCFALRNARANRLRSIETGLITLDQHTAWFKHRLGCVSSVMFIAEAGGLPIGTVRFDIESTAAVTSIMLDPSLQGRGLGKPLLETAIDTLYNRLGPVKVIALIKDDNTASLRLFKSAGFYEKSSDNALVRLERLVPDAADSQHAGAMR